MSLRRPTVALLSFTFDLSPLCGVAQTSDCGTLVIYFWYKPFMWCRSDVRLWHARYLLLIQALYVMSLQTSDCGTHCYLFSIISPLCGVALTPDCGIVISFVSFRGVIQTLDWPSVLFWDFGRTTARLPFYLPCIAISFSECALLNLFTCIMFTFVISYVRTILRVLS